MHHFQCVSSPQRTELILHTQTGTEISPSLLFNARVNTVVTPPKQQQPFLFSQCTSVFPFVASESSLGGQQQEQTTSLNDIKSENYRVSGRAIYVLWHISQGPVLLVQFRPAPQTQQSPVWGHLCPTCKCVKPWLVVAPSFCTVQTQVQTSKQFLVFSISWSG